MRNKIVLLTLTILVCGHAKSQTSSPNGTWTDRAPSGTWGPFKNFNMYSNNTGIDGSFTNFNSIANTKGRRYLFDGWAKGVVVTTDGEVVKNDSMFFNFDKMKYDLLATTDKKNIIAVNKNDIKSFTLSDGKDNYYYERVDLINSTDFFQVIAQKDGAYGVYKLNKTTFEKSEYHSDGLMESGNPYDEYKDASTYYLVNFADKSVQKIDLKKKTIKQVFSKDSAKVDQYFNSHSSDPVNEDFIKGLIDYLNS